MAYGHAHLLTSPRCQVDGCARHRQVVEDDGREICARHALDNATPLPLDSGDHDRKEHP